MRFLNFVKKTYICKKITMNQHQDYDKIIKETIEKIGYPILQKLIGIAGWEIQNLPTSLPRTIERRADFLKLAKNTIDAKQQIYHLEFQSSVHPKMAQRMMVYFSLLYEKYEMPIHQYVIYLGTGKWTAPKELLVSKMNFAYEVINLQEIDYELFMQSDVPEEIILAILGDFKKENNTKVVAQIIQQLQSKTKNKKRLQKLIMQLEILSNLRNLQPIIKKQLSTMLIDYDITKDLRYLEGIEKGIEKGIINSYKNGIAIALIANIFNLPEQKIKQILKENNLL
jgi:hypothetical protein